MSTHHQSIFITGAASGIGRATAELFHAKGWFVGAFDIDEVGLKQLESTLGGRRCYTQYLDVCHPAEWSAAVEVFLQRSSGRLDVLFNNAGMGAAGWFEDVPQQVAEQLIQVNLMGAVNGVYACRDALAETPGSHLINNGSVLALQGPPFGAIYGASKAGLRSLSESLELELARDDIRVTLLLPSAIDTPFTDRPAYTQLETAVNETNTTPASEVAQAVWESVQKPRLFQSVGRGSALIFWMVRWVPGIMRWLTRRWLKKISGS